MHLHISAHRFTVLLAFSVLLTFIAGREIACAQDVQRIAADDARLQYAGRFDHRDPAGPRCEWSASSVTLHIRGSDISADMADTRADDAFQVVVDGRPDHVFSPGGGPHTIQIVKDLPAGDHVVAIVKRTEAFVGCAQFRSFTLPNGTTLLAPGAPAHKIEVIGDSISCGYGNEAKSEKEHFTAATENAYLAYGAIAARAVDAEYTCIAWSGKKIWPDKMLPDLYDLTLPTDPTSVWDFKSSAPDVVLLNFGTNDFGPGIPDADKWTAAYAAFVARVRGHYPKALIYLASGTMMSDSWPPGQNALSTLNRYLERVRTLRAATGDDHIHLLLFGSQDAAVDGLGADYHPSLKTDQKMADKFVAAMQKDLGYAITPPQP